MRSRAASRFGLALLCATLIAAAAPAQDDNGPPWLAKSHDPRALSWVATQRERVLARLQAQPRFAGFKADAQRILTDPDRLPDLTLIGDSVYQYWQDEARPLGVWRRTSVALFVQGHPDWETVIDLDALAAREHRKWIFQDAACRGQRCLVRLADNGRDAAAIREFDLVSKTFVDEGFVIPDSKSRAWWSGPDTLLVAPAADHGPGNFLPPPRTLRIWRRGSPLASARTVFAIAPKDVTVSAALINAMGDGAFLAARQVDAQQRAWRIVAADGSSRAAPLPPYAHLFGADAGRLLLSPDVDWSPPGSGRTFAAGALVAVPIADLFQRGSVAGAELAFTPATGDAVRNVITGDGRLLLELLHDNASALAELLRSDRGWSSRPVPLAPGSFITPMAVSGGRLLARIEAPLEPPRLALIDPATGAEQVLLRQPPQFDTAGLVSEVWHARSRDGADIAYLVTHRAGIAFDGSNPTLVYGYGGYGVPLTPRYEPIFGKLWMERGGVYVHAYLRGGGEHGPTAWRDTMLDHHRRPIEDMIAVLQDLQRRGVSSPATTGIIGRSEGGLMVSAVMEQAPDLLNAVVIGGPLVDIITRATLPAEGPWLTEHGDPADPALAAYIRSYSPMQNVAGPDRHYPTPLIITATGDDRVLPGVARRFSTRLSSRGHDNLYFEDEQGGHYWELAGPPVGDWRLRARARAVEFTYLWGQLGTAALRP